MEYGPTFGDWYTSFGQRSTGEPYRAVAVDIDGGRGQLMAHTVKDTLIWGLLLEDGFYCPESCPIRFRVGAARFNARWDSRRRLRFEENSHFSSALQQNSETQFRVTVRDMDHYYSASNRGFASAFVWILTNGSMVLPASAEP